MKSVSTLLLVSVIGLWACNSDQGDPEKKNGDVIGNALLFDTMTIEKESGDCAKSETGCFTLLLQYPRIKEDSAAEVLNTQILRFLMGSFKDSFETAEQYSNYLLKEYENQASLVKGFPGWHKEKVMTVVYASNGLLTLRMEAFENTGGAHPENKTQFRNYLVYGAKRIFLEDLFKDNYRDSLLSLARFHLRQALQIDLEVRVDGQKADSDEMAFQLSDNFLIDENGISFLYERDALSSAGEGEVEFTIPYSQLIEYDLIKESGPLGFIILGSPAF